MINRTNRNNAEVMRDEMTMKDRILSILNNNPKTIPEIAEEIEFPAAEIMFWIMAFHRYGFIEAIGKANEDGFYKYRQVENKEIL